MSRYIFAFALAALVASPVAAQAQQPKPKLIQQFNAWGSYVYQTDKGKTCFVLSVPTAKKPADVDHGDVYFMVSRRPSNNISYQPEAQMGYKLKGGSKVNVDVGGKDFVMFTSGDRAWVENAAQEPALVADMRAGSTMTVKAESDRGTKTEYTYSLSGVTAALDKIKGCN